ncbi:MAG: NAD(P)/FAD-dependent oxidoreductase [Clostridia bacterium]|nr:NAD(P)/FAD-dependent oxidoreductase [Clostridia bacterium]
MIRVDQIKLPIDYSDSDVKKGVARLLGVNLGDIKRYDIIKKSIDSRDKTRIRYVLSAGVSLQDENKYLSRHPKATLYTPPSRQIESILPKDVPAPSKRPVIVGLGPAGLFAGLTLAKAGLRPIILERGKSVDERAKSVGDFINTCVLDTQSNLQFGEGGAGTFSDGKLNTGTGSSLISVVFGEFVKFGAPPQILYDAKPHVGTDKLRDVIKNMRNEILSLGGEVYFDSQFVDVKTKSGKLTAVEVDTKDRGRWSIDCDCCILAVGHSARDTFEMLVSKVEIEQKPFSIGARIEHLQSAIDKGQYGEQKGLPPANYSLSCHLDNGRSCYTFCMCPGGYVMPATSEENAVVTNGMSYYARDGVNANSALLVGVQPSDFGSSNPLAGVEFQRKYERLAYAVSHSYKAPCQRYEDLAKGRESGSFGQVLPTYPIGVTTADLRACLPSYVTDSIVEAVKVFDKKLKGFADGDALLTGVESRSSSPIRIFRNEAGDSSIEGLMPCGEGAGYAGGITSASVDGINVALKYIRKLFSN